MSFIPYHSPKGTVDVAVADEGFRAALEAKLDQMRRITIRWVPVMQEISRLRRDAHWCSYDDGKVCMFLTLEREESFADLEPIYDMIGKHVRRLEKQNGYKGKFVADPDPNDDTDTNWRKWAFWAGDDSRFELIASFYLSRHCRVVIDGTETVTVEKKRVQCGETAEDLSAAA
jgi:hypothetical protein